MVLSNLFDSSLSRSFHVVSVTHCWNHVQDRYIYEDNIGMIELKGTGSNLV